MSNLRIIGGTLAAVVAATAPGVAYFEGVLPYTYADPVGIPTACAGETGAHIKFGQTYSIEQCMAMLDASLARHWAGLERCVDADVTINQASALLSWTYNVGVGNACRSTLVRLLNAGAEPDVWCHQLTRWTKARKLGVLIELPGLVKRRSAEMAMCLDGDWRIVHLDGVPWRDAMPFWLARIDRRRLAANDAQWTWSEAA